MKQRGRPSSAALSIVSNVVSQLDRVERQKPPEDLLPDEVVVWRGVVDAEPADWFSPSTVPLLAQYCRHVVHASRVAEMIEQAMADPDLKIASYDRLLKMQERESRAIATLATKMRIAQQSTSNHRGNKKPSTTAKPWD